MGNVTKIRSDYDADKLRKLAKQSDDADQTRRLLALAAIYDGRAPRSSKNWRGWAANSAGLGGGV
jgi:hypothetical protein